MRRAARAVVALAAAAGCSGCVTMPPNCDMRVVALPVADVRSEPGTLPAPGAHDARQETQVVYGEPVCVQATQGAWASIEAIEQPEFTHNNRWQGYPGWVMQDMLRPWSNALARPTAVVTSPWAPVWRDASGTEPWFQLPAGARITVIKPEGILWPVRLVSGATGWISRSQVRLLDELRRLPTAQRRQQIVSFAEAFLGSPYFWGGRCSFTPRETGTVTGVDCSGLVNLAYRMAGLDVPRDAHEQFMRARAVPTPQLADVIFLSDHGRPNWIVHVMLYAGDGWLIEAPGTGGAVHRVQVAERLGRPLEEIHPGDSVGPRADRAASVGDQTVWFGTLLP